MDRVRSVPGAITARLRPGISVTDTTEWRCQVVEHELTDPPPIADITVTITGRWARRELVDAVCEIADQLVHRGLMSEGPAIRAPKQRTAA